MKSNIIVCEDNNIIALDIKTELKILGYENSIVLNCGEDIIDYLKQDIPGLIIMDINLGGKIKGEEALKTILNEYDVPVIILNGYRDQIYGDIADRRNVMVVRKPFTPAELKLAVNELLNANKSLT